MTVLKKDLSIDLPILDQFFLNLKFRLYDCFNKTLPQCNIEVIFQSKNHLSNLFRLKTAFPKNLNIRTGNKY